MAIINARSPHYISITNASIAYATLDISIYDGNINGQPTVNYSLKKYIVGTNTTVSFEISELLKDFLDVEFNGNYNESAEANGACKWVDTTIKAFNVSAVQVGSSVNTVGLTLNSYGYFEEGSSFSLSDESLIVSDGDIFLPKFGDSNIAIYTGNNPTVSLLDSSGTSVASSSFTSSNESTEQIEYVSLYPELVTNLGFDDATDWTIQSNDVIEDGLLKFGGQSGSRYPNTFTPVTGINYILNFTITEVNSGFLNGVYDGSGGINLTGRIDKVGDYSVQYTQTSTTSNLVSFFSLSGFNGAMDNVSVKEVYEVTKVSVTDDNKTRTRDVKQVEECKFEPHKVTFVNKNGVLQDMHFFKKSTDKMTTKRDNYNSNIIKSDNTYSINQHTKVDFNITANESVKLSTGFLNESTNESFKQLMLSEKVWVTKAFQNSTLVLPINIKTSNITYKTSLNDRLVEYSIEFENSYNSINNIR